MDRISKSFLQAQVDRINRITGSPAAPYAKDANGQYQPQARCYHLSGAYGGYALHRMCDTGSCVHDIFGGYMPKRELSQRMSAFIAGLQATDQAA